MIVIMLKQSGTCFTCIFRGDWLWPRRTQNHMRVLTSPFRPIILNAGEKETASQLTWMWTIIVPQGGVFTSGTLVHFPTLTRMGTWPDSTCYVFSSWSPAGHVPTLWMIPWKLATPLFWIEMPLSGNRASRSNLPLRKHRLCEHGWDCPHKARPDLHLHPNICSHLQWVENRDSKPVVSWQ